MAYTTDIPPILWVMIGWVFGFVVGLRLRGLDRLIQQVKVKEHGDL